jgi:hypothetical protein
MTDNQKQVSYFQPLLDECSRLTLSFGFRIRRVKCDETKPDCLRCIRTGRKCDGYASSLPISEASVTDNSNRYPPFAPRNRPPPSNLTQSMSSIVLRDSLQDFRGTKLEHRHLDFFYNQTAPSLARYFDSRFWNILVPQLACSEPSVQHAMIALASFHEHCNTENGAVMDHSK